MPELDEILKLNPDAAAGLDGAREALANIKKLREAGMAPGPLLPNPSGHRQTLDQLKAVKPRRFFNLTLSA